ncbi:MAG: adenosine deaminase [bacterium]|nr:MAG: adenosine deaminase [bacterium]
MIDKNQIRETIKTMPKIELHLHLEGAFTFEFLFELIQKYGGDPSVKTIYDLEKKFIFKDFPHFIETWFWKNQFFKSPDDFEQSTYFTLKNLHKQNVIYAEVFFSPWDFVQFGLQVEAITEATLCGIQRAKNDFGIRCQLIADLCRDYGAEKAIDRFSQIIPYRDKGLIGIGLGGSEHDFPPDPFEKVYKFAKEKGFHRVAHAGEAAGAESVWGAIQQLNVERIGHGVRAIEDPTLIEYLKEKQIPLEICVTSNLKTAIFPSPETHPIKQFFDNGLLVTVNSDDPTMFGATITDEYVLLYKTLDFTTESLKKLTINAVKASFLSDSEKQIITNRTDEFWQ